MIIIPILITIVLGFFALRGFFNQSSGDLAGGMIGAIEALLGLLWFIPILISWVVYFAFT